MTDTEFMKIFRRDWVNLGGVKLAAQIGVTPQHISDVKQGHRPPGPAVLAYYGLERVVKRVVTYVDTGKK